MDISSITRNPAKLHEMKIITTVRPIKLWNRKTTFNHVKFMCVFEVVEKPKVLPLHCIIGLLKIVS